MDPARRRILEVRIEDAVEADSLFRADGMPSSRAASSSRTTRCDVRNLDI
jgi:hypothetical protein